jgi:DNA processing protein
VAVVGTRRATPYGKQVASELSEILANSGVTVVSGLARGIDTIAHTSAVKASGRTIGILGSGVDQIYPPENERLVEKIITNGAIISDYPPGTPPDSANFPPRNRIISALARAVIVVEAGENSGALITAAFAAEQGREVFAVPGNIHAHQSKGSNRLIQQGARLFLKTNDVLEVLNLTQISEYKDARSTLPTDPTEAALFTLLSQEPKHVDDIKNQLGIPIDHVMATLTLMELKGYIRQVSGMSYIAIREYPVEYKS